MRATTPVSRGSCWPSGDSMAPLHTKGYLHRSRPPNVGRWNAPTPGTTISTSSPDAPNVDRSSLTSTCLLYTSDAADDLLCVDLGGRRIIKKKKKKTKKNQQIT